MVFSGVILAYGFENASKQCDIVQNYCIDNISLRKFAKRTAKDIVNIICIIYVNLRFFSTPTSNIVQCKHYISIKTRTNASVKLII